MNDRDKPNHVRYGDPRSPGGAMYLVRNLVGATEVMKDAARMRLQEAGVVITRHVEALLELKRREAERRLRAEIRARGIPANIQKLLNARKKKEVERLAKNMVIHQRDLTDLICNYDQAGWSYRVKHPKFVPEHLRLSDDERRAFFENGVGPLHPKAKKAFSKIKTTFRDRRCVSAHMFQRGYEWHCFYMSYDDVSVPPETGRNHWKHGTHLHYVSHLWPRLGPDEVLDAFDDRTQKFPGVHIRFRWDEDE